MRRAIAAPHVERGSDKVTLLPGKEERVDRPDKLGKRTELTQECRGLFQNQCSLLIFDSPKN